VHNKLLNLTALINLNLYVYIIADIPLLPTYLLEHCNNIHTNNINQEKKFNFYFYPPYPHKQSTNRLIHGASSIKLHCYETYINVFFIIKKKKLLLYP